MLQQTGAAIGLIALWLLSDAITKQPVARGAAWLTIVGSVLMIPSIVLVMEWHRWTEVTAGLRCAIYRLGRCGCFVAAG